MKAVSSYLYCSYISAISLASDNVLSGITAQDSHCKAANTSKPNLLNCSRRDLLAIGHLAKLAAVSIEAVMARVRP